MDNDNNIHNNIESFSEEVEELKHEIDMFVKEKERVRTIVGRIGGIPNHSTKLVNLIFLILLITSVVISLYTGGKVAIAMIEIAVTLLSIKFIYMIENQAKVNHFQLWILSSIEWKINESSKKISKLCEDVEILKNENKKSRPEKSV